MSFIRRWSWRLRGLLRRRRFDDELRAEMQHHLEMQAREHQRAGMDPEAAYRAARLGFGGPDAHRQQAHDERWGAGLDAVVKDVRYAARGLRNSPGFALVAITTLALAVGANAAVFGLVRATLLTPLPYGEPERILRFRTGWQGTLDRGTSPAEYLDFLAELRSFDALGAYSYQTLTLTSDGDAQRVPSAFGTVGLLPALGIEPQLGRSFVPEDATGDFPVLIAAELWRTAFGAAPDVVGQELTLNGSTAQVIGVLPEGFRLPEQLVAGDVAQVIGVFAFDPGAISNRGSHYLSVIGRVGDASSRAAAVEEVEQLGRWMNTTFPDAYPVDMQFRITAAPLADFVVRDVRSALWLLAAAVALVLLVASANLAGLLLSRGEERLREFALRTALGAGRGRILSQVFTEALLLAALGAAAGIMLAAGMIRATILLASTAVPRLAEARVDGAVVVAAVAAAVLAALFFGAVPAARVRSGALSAALSGDPRTTAGSRGSRALRSVLVVGQLAVAVLLLTGAGLLTRSFAALARADVGYETAQVTTARVALPRAAYAENAAVTAFWRELTTRLAGRAGIANVGAVTNLPLATRLGDMNFEIEGRPVADDAVSPAAYWQAVTPGYLEALGVSPQTGRLIAAGDTVDTEGVVVINETLAERNWPGEAAVGQRLLLGGGAGPGWVRVIGIVKDVAHTRVDEEPRAQFYVAHQQFRFWGSGNAARSMSLAVRSPLPPAAVADTMRTVLRELDPGLALFNVRSFDAVRSAAVAQPRMLSLLLAAFAIVAVSIASVGAYGVIAYGVAQRRREFGIRLALGATPREVRNAVLHHGLVMSGAGLALGLSGGALIAGAARPFLYNVGPGDPLTLIGVVAVLALVSMAAAWVPAGRAVRQDATALLRAE